MNINHKYVLIAALAFVAVMACQGSVSASYDVWAHDSAPAAADFTASGTYTSLTDYTGTRSFGGSGASAQLYQNNIVTTYWYLAPNAYPTSMAILGTSQVTISFWYHIYYTGGSSSTSATIAINYGGSNVQTYTSTQGTSKDVSGYLTYTFTPTVGSNLYIAGKTNNAVAQTYFYIDEINITVNCAATEAMITPIYVYDEYTGALMASGTLTNTLYDTASTGTSVTSAAGTSLLTVYAFDSTLARYSVTFSTVNRVFYLDSEETNRVAVNGTTSYTMAVVDSSGTYGANTHMLAYREFGGYNVTCEERLLSWAGMCYPYFKTSSYYVITFESPGGDSLIYGNISAFDNPMYIVLDVASSSADDPTYNSTELVPQTWNTSFTDGWQDPDAAGDVWALIAADGDWGQWILLGLPIFFMIIAGAQYAFASGMIAASICAALNAAIGWAWYNTGILGWIAAICLLMLVRDAMKQDHAIGGS